MIVEIPQNSANKYEYDGNLGVFRLDRALYSPLHYPGDYGFIPGTLADDNDPLDVLVLVQQPSYPGVMIEVRPVGGLNMVDGHERQPAARAIYHRGEVDMRFEGAAIDDDHGAQRNIAEILNGGLDRRRTRLRLDGVKDQIGKPRQPLPSYWPRPSSCLRSW